MKAWLFLLRLVIQKITIVKLSKKIKVVQRLLKQSQQLLKLPHEKKQLQFKR